MMAPAGSGALEDRTIRDFGEQWTHYGDSEGFYGSPELFADIVAPWLTPADFAGRRVAEIGSGAGRIVGMMLECGAAHVLAVEPSDGHVVAQRHLARYGDRVSFLHARGAELPPTPPFDLIVSVGVLQFIPEPKPVVDAAFAALVPGGRFFVWLYAREGTGLYRAALGTLRALGRTVPHPALAALVRVLDVPLALYMRLCRRLPLPLRDYLVNVLARFSPETRRLVIYDQLNPTHAHYHSRAEAEQLLLASGFTDVRLHHRRGYSWSVIGRKPGG
jgi:SAM-dependent methyltransferase